MNNLHEQTDQISILPITVIPAPPLSAHTYDYIEGVSVPLNKGNGKMSNHSLSTVWLVLCGGAKLKVDNSYITDIMKDSSEGKYPVWRSEWYTW